MQNSSPRPDRTLALCATFLIVLSLFSVACGNKTKCVAGLSYPQALANPEVPFLERCGEDIGPDSDKRKFTFLILGDSQIQTTRWMGFDKPYRMIFMDKRISNVALRPAALDRASAALLKGVLESGLKHEPDMILYLGDGANNGCIDEIISTEPARDGRPTTKGYLSVLRAFRKTHGKPVFVIPGNHDYLANGNSSTPKRRRKYCGSRKPVAGESTDEHENIANKMRLIEELYKFNTETARLFPEWKYESSYSDAVERCKSASSDSKQHETPGCYLAGIARKDDIEILLVDTSDYANTKFHQERDVWVPFFGRSALAGSRGSFTWHKEHAQLDWFLKRIEPSESAVERKGMRRIVASHYGLDDLRASVEFVDLSSQIGNPSPLAFAGDPSVPIWVSAHSHWRRSASMCMTTKKKKEKKRYIREVRVGSTSDWRPQAVVLEHKGRGNTWSAEIVSIDETKCQDVFSALMKDTEQIGIGYGYRNYKRPTEERLEAMAALDERVQEISLDTGMKEEEVMACAGWLASWYENL